MFLGRGAEGPALALGARGPARPLLCLLEGIRNLVQLPQVVVHHLGHNVEGVPEALNRPHIVIREGIPILTSVDRRRSRSSDRVTAGLSRPSELEEESERDRLRAEARAREEDRCVLLA